MKITIILCVLFYSCSSCFTQKNNEVITTKQASKNPDSIVMVDLAAFDYDTAQYLNENLIKNKQLFVNRELSVLIGKLEIPVKSYFIGEKFNQPKFVPEMTLVFTDFGKLLNDKRQEKYKLVTIIWQDPISKDSTFELLLKTKGVWSEQAYEFYKNHLIKDIRMVER